MNTCIFCKIGSGEVAKEFTYQDQDVMVFPDINPFKPTHLLVVPKKHIEDFKDLTDKSVSEKINSVLQKMIKETGLDKNGYRLVINGGGAQQVNHLHVHLTGPWGRGESL